MEDALFIARKWLEEITPLKKDCGRICRAACCASLEGEETGMLLFPGEEVLYLNRPEWVLRRTDTGNLLLICPGICNRTDRPLSCRLFPLLPFLSEGSIRVRMDLRARAVCPLARQGIRALDPVFPEAVRQVGEILLSEERQRLFLERLSAEQEDLRALKKRFI